MLRRRRSRRHPGPHFIHISIGGVLIVGGALADAQDGVQIVEQPHARGCAVAAGPLRATSASGSSRHPMLGRCVPRVGRARACPRRPDRAAGPRASGSCSPDRVGQAVDRIRAARRGRASWRRRATATPAVVAVRAADATTTLYRRLDPDTASDALAAAGVSAALLIELDASGGDVPHSTILTLKHDGVDVDALAASSVRCAAPSTSRSAR